MSGALRKTKMHHQHDLKCSGTAKIGQPSNVAAKSLYRHILHSQPPSSAAPSLRHRSPGIRSSGRSPATAMARGPLGGLSRAEERKGLTDHLTAHQYTALGLHTSWGGGHLRHPDFPRTIGKSSKSTIFHGFSMKNNGFSGFPKDFGKSGCRR